jgi:hypothetical protein
MFRHFCLVGFVAAVVASSSAQPLGRSVIMPDPVNNRVVSFDWTSGDLLNANAFSLQGGDPVHILEIHDEFWVTERTGSRISRWSISGEHLGNIGGPFAGGGVDDPRGLLFYRNQVYAANAGTRFGAPGSAILAFDRQGNLVEQYLLSGQAENPWGVLLYGHGVLVSSADGPANIYHQPFFGTGQGPFHASHQLAGAGQMSYTNDGFLLAASPGNDRIVRMNTVTGEVLGWMPAPGVLGVMTLEFGDLLWSNAGGVFRVDRTTGLTTQVYSGGGGMFSHTIVPEPATALVLLGGLAALARVRRRAGRP